MSPKVAGTPVKTNFNNSNVLIQSWYCLGVAKEIKPKETKGYTLHKRRLVLYRAEDGKLHALAGSCAHLGANLAYGQVVGDKLQCAFHHWQYNSRGKCCYAPGLNPPPKRQVRVYPVLEKWGLIWVFNGPEPLFDLPEPISSHPYYALRLPRQHINCHPHLVIANGLDSTHFEPLHKMQLAKPPIFEVNFPYRVTLALAGRPQSNLARYVTGSRRVNFEATFTTIGGNLAWVTVDQPLHFHVLFSGKPSSQGGCDTQTLFFFPNRLSWRWLQAFALMMVLLYDDHRILDDIDFRPAFVETDGALRAFVDLVNEMKVW